MSEEQSGTTTTTSAKTGSENVFTDTFQKFKAVIMTPNAFFENMPLQGGLQEPFMFVLLVSVVSGLGVALFTLKPIQGISEVVVRIILSFVSAAYLLVVARGLGGTGNFEGTYRAFAYAAAPAIISWIPLLNLLAGVYGLFLMRLGLERSHGLTTQRAWAVVGIWMVTLVGLITIIVVMKLITVAGAHNQAIPGI